MKRTGEQGSEQRLYRPGNQSLGFRSVWGRWGNVQSTVRQINMASEEDRDGERKEFFEEIMTKNVSRFERKGD